MGSSTHRRPTLLRRPRAALRLITRPAPCTVEYSDVRHLGPVFHGDTIYAESSIVGKDGDVVEVESQGLNQRGEKILTLRRKIVLP